MDLLYTRYASPFTYLDTLLDNNRLLEGITYMIDADRNEKLWQLYLHSYPTESFEQWKEKIVVKSNEGMSKNEIVREVEKSQKILKTFSLEERG